MSDFDFFNLSINVQSDQALTLTYAEIKNLCQVARFSREDHAKQFFKNFCNNQGWWQLKFKQDFPERVEDFDFDVDWREAYAETLNKIFLLRVTVDPTQALELIAMGADPNFKGEGGETALMRAYSKGDPGYIADLIEAGANPNLRDDQGNTIVHYLVDNYIGFDLETIKSMLSVLASAGTNFNIANRYKTTPLMQAMGNAFGKKGDPIVKALMEAKTRKKT